MNKWEFSWNARMLQPRKILYIGAMHHIHGIQGEKTHDHLN